MYNLRRVKVHVLTFRHIINVTPVHGRFSLLFIFPLRLAIFHLRFLLLTVAIVSVQCSWFPATCGALVTDLSVDACSILVAITTTLITSISSPIIALIVVTSPLIARLTLTSRIVFMAVTPSSVVHMTLTYLVVAHMTLISFVIALPVLISPVPITLISVVAAAPFTLPTITLITLASLTVALT